MKKYFKPILMSIVITFFMFLTINAMGWILFFFGIVYLASYIFEIIIIWKLYESKGKEKRFLIITFIVFIILCLFREDGGDTSQSIINGLSIIENYAGLIETAYYEESTTLFYSFNFLWFIFLGYQIIYYKKN